MKDDKIKIISAIIVWFLTAWMLYYAWNHIAVEFCLPTFGFWTAFAITYVIDFIFHPSHKKE